ncbi:hypothetical protein ES703_104841 [subsurface metagenome]
MVAQGVDDLGDRQRAGHAEIGRAIDRDARRRPGIVDDVADPHDVGGDHDIGAQAGSGDDFAFFLREGAGRAGEEGEGDEERAGDHEHHPQRNICEVACSIWSAAETTLAFIS